MAKNNTKFQLVPPHTHRANSSEKSIQIFNNDFKFDIFSIDTEFTMPECYRFLNQLFLTINVLR